MMIGAATAGTLETDVPGFLDQRSAAPQSPGGIDLVGLFSAAPVQTEGLKARDRNGLRKALPVLLDTVLEMSFEEALATCAGPNAEVVGLKTCSALAKVAQREELEAQLDDRLAAAIQ
ncbi:MAG: hypothetical protein AAFY38_14750 [Pseudomonadota bacterium]